LCASYTHQIALSVRLHISRGRHVIRSQNRRGAASCSAPPPGARTHAPWPPCGGPRASQHAAFVCPSSQCRSLPALAWQATCASVGPPIIRGTCRMRVRSSSCTCACVEWEERSSSQALVSADPSGRAGEGGQRRLCVCVCVCVRARGLMTLRAWLACWRSARE
jgi:hypothetical protein